MADAVVVQYKQLGKPIITIQDAIKASSFFDDDVSPRVITIGDAKSEICIIVLYYYMLVLKNCMVVEATLYCSYSAVLGQLKFICMPTVGRVYRVDMVTLQAPAGNWLQLNFYSTLTTQTTI